MHRKTHAIVVPRSARYVTLGEPTERTRRVWFVLHGYGQLAEYFVRKFEPIADGQTLVVAPEALSRFYLATDSDRVGASWMTRHDRLHEIDDYVKYLDRVHEAVLGDRSDLHTTVLGFSQGTATACRWVNRGRLRCDRLILWGGYFANGMLELVEPDKLPPQETHFVYGDGDEFLSPLNPDAYLEKLRAEVPSMNIIKYRGGHSIDREVLFERFGPARTDKP